MQTSITIPTIADDAPSVSTGAPLGRIGRWELVSLASEGSLARTYRARPVGSPVERPAAYAVKVLREEFMSDPRALALFCREVQLGRTVANPHLISILAAGLVKPPYFLVMPWLEGQSLRKLLDDGRPPELPMALWITRQAAEALEVLAAAGWRHGDLKPSNLFVSPDGHVTVLDLGLARRAGEIDSVLERSVSGTCHYLAPEAVTSTLASDPRSDIYSLGVVLFEMLTGRLPFPGDSLEAIVRQHREAKVPELRRLAPHLPSGVVRLVRQMLSKEPLRRPRTPGELIDRLVRLEVQSFSERASR